MADHITLYVYSGENNRLTKTLTNGAVFNQPVYRSEIDFHDPVFTIESTVSAVYNYCEIEEAGVVRYYFAQVENVREGLSRITCRLDVLQTYSAQIKNCPCIPIRSSDQYNSWIYDSQLPFEVAATSYSLPPVGQAGVDYAVWDYDNMSLIVGAIGASVWEAIEPWQT